MIDPKAGIYASCSERGKKDPFLLLDIFSNDLKESARLNELVHLAALEAAATAAQTGGGREWREEGKAGGCVRRKGAGGRREEREHAERGERRGGSQEDARAAAEPGWSAH